MGVDKTGAKISGSRVDDLRFSRAYDPGLRLDTRHVAVLYRDGEALFDPVREDIDNPAVLDDLIGRLFSLCSGEEPAEGFYFHDHRLEENFPIVHQSREQNQITQVSARCDII